jgi:hypothetical protein
MFAETSGNLQHSNRRIPEVQSHTLNSTHESQQQHRFRGRTLNEFCTKRLAISLKSVFQEHFNCKTQRV